MKKHLPVVQSKRRCFIGLLTLTLLGVLGTLIAAEGAARSETDAITEVLQLYVDVMDKGAKENIQKAFHPDTKFMSINRNDGLNQMTLDEWWNRISGAAGKTQRTNKITVFDVSGLAAVAKVDFGRSQDYMTLLKISGEWKIVNKVLSTKL